MSDVSETARGSVGNGSFAHHMLAEIWEQPRSLRRTLDHYVAAGSFRPEATARVLPWLRATRNGVTMAASGSSRHAAMVAAVDFADGYGLHVDVEYASEFAYRQVCPQSRTPLAVISQSGETADTLASLRSAKAQGSPTLAITNAPASSMDAEADICWPTLAGREIAVPATKSFTAQLLVLQLLSCLAREQEGDSAGASLSAFERLPVLVESQLEAWQEAAFSAAEAFRQAESAIFLGRDVLFPIALEGALKLEETSYLPAQGMPGGELKHGPNALVSPCIPLVFLMTHDPAEPGSAERYRRMVDLLHDMRAQGATLVAVCNDDDEHVRQATPHVIPVPAAPGPLLPILTVIPLQLLAYRIAANRGMPIDTPRNLSKAVLTE